MRFKGDIYGNIIYIIIRHPYTPYPWCYLLGIDIAVFIKFVHKQMLRHRLQNRITHAQINSSMSITQKNMNRMVNATANFFPSQTTKGAYKNFADMIELPVFPLF